MGESSANDLHKARAELLKSRAVLAKALAEPFNRARTPEAMQMFVEVQKKDRGRRLCYQG
jgi:hypothetical protein